MSFHFAFEKESTSLSPTKKKTYALRQCQPTPVALQISELGSQEPPVWDTFLWSGPRNLGFVREIPHWILSCFEETTASHTKVPNIWVTPLLAIGTTSRDTDTHTHTHTLSASHRKPPKKHTHIHIHKKTCFCFFTDKNKTISFTFPHIKIQLKQNKRQDISGKNNIQNLHHLFPPLPHSRLPCTRKPNPDPNNIYDTNTHFACF